MTMAAAFGSLFGRVAKAVAPVTKSTTTVAKQAPAATLAKTAPKALAPSVIQAPRAIPKIPPKVVAGGLAIGGVGLAYVGGIIDQGCEKLFGEAGVCDALDAPRRGVTAVVGRFGETVHAFFLLALAAGLTTGVGLLSFRMAGTSFNRLFAASCATFGTGAVSALLVHKELQAAD